VIRTALLLCLVLLGGPALAGPQLDVPADAQPGALIVGHAMPGSTVTVDGERVRVSPDGLFLAGIARDDTGVRSIVATSADGSISQAAIGISGREYDVQRIDGLPQKTVTPDPETSARIGREIAQIKEVRKADTAEALFANGFQWPVTGRISGVYGSQRILNGEPRRPHYGVDIAAPEGTPVVAMADGVVRLAHPDMVLTGQTVMIDHGHGLMSVYVHMSETTVAEGQRIAKGEMIGRVGQTGRATGPHLHWGVTLFSTQLDPALVAGPMPE